MHQGRQGGIEVVCGSMFSGKTEELLRRLKRAQYGRLRIQVFKPEIDNRYSAEHVQSHDANRILSHAVSHSWQILELLEDATRVVGIDEAQFFDEGIVDVVNRLATRGIRVIVAGLDMDFRGLPFGPMPKLLAVAEDVTKLSAVCVVCGAPASRSQRVPQAAGAALSTSVVLVGARDLYEARCRTCHETEPAQGAPVSTSVGLRQINPSTENNQEVENKNV